VRWSLRGNVGVKDAKLGGSSDVVPDEEWLYGELGQREKKCRISPSRREVPLRNYKYR